MEKEGIYGPFQEVASFSKKSAYFVVGKTDNEDNSEERIVLFNSETIRYYGQWDQSEIEGNQKEGIVIREDPIFVFVNPNPKESVNQRVEIDFS